jgi:hypothetical protein
LISIDGAAAAVYLLHEKFERLCEFDHVCGDVRRAVRD